jgi:hypothetical protein
VSVFFADGGDHQQVTRPRRGHVGNAQRLILFGFGFFLGGIEQFPRCAPENALCAHAPLGIAVAIAALQPS